MKLSYKILLFTTNHITGNLVYLKLKSYGHDVLKAEASEVFTEALARKSFDLVIVDDLKNSFSEIRQKLTELKIPHLFMNNKKNIDSELEKISIKLSFLKLWNGGVVLQSSPFLYTRGFFSQVVSKNSFTFSLLPTISSNWFSTSSTVPGTIVVEKGTALELEEEELPS